MTDSTVTVVKPSKPATPASEHSPTVKALAQELAAKAEADGHPVMKPAAKPAKRTPRSPKRKAATDKKTATKQAAKPATPTTTDKSVAAKKPGRPPMTPEQLRAKVDAAIAKKQERTETIGAVNTIFDPFAHLPTTATGKRSTPIKPLATYAKSVKPGAAHPNERAASARQTGALLTMLVAQSKPMRTGVVITRVFDCPDPRAKKASNTKIACVIENGCLSDMLRSGYVAHSNKTDDPLAETYKLTSRTAALVNTSTGGAAMLAKSGVKTS